MHIEVCGRLFLILSYLVSPCTNEFLYGYAGTETPFACELPFPALSLVSNHKLGFP